MKDTIEYRVDCFKDKAYATARRTLEGWVTQGHYKTRAEADSNAEFCAREYPKTRVVEIKTAYSVVGEYYGEED